jgi:hypothetical protein
MVTGVYGVSVHSTVEVDKSAFKIEEIAPASASTAGLTATGRSSQTGDGQRAGKACQPAITIPVGS